VFHAGTRREGDSFVTAGGRVLYVSALGPSIADARNRAYDAAACISWPGVYYRRDIAATV
jgi:phosphoribosylamine--glycine ligase